MSPTRNLLTLAFTLLGATTFAQDTLDVDRAVAIAVQRNGKVRAAFLDYEAAKANTKIAYSPFLPTVTPSLTKDFSRTQNYTGSNKGSFDTSFSSAVVDFGWKLWDNGSRGLTLDRAKLNQQIAEYNALQTVRNVLFNVQTSFYDALRAQELLRVQTENLKRAQEILDQTRIRANPPIEDIPRKDVLQAEADYQNARVSMLSAQNQVGTTSANLKAILAIEEKTLPTLVAPESRQADALGFGVESAFAQGLENRPDLAASRLRVESQSLAVRAARLDGGVTYSVDANARQAFADDVFNRASLQFSASIPLFDGQRTKQQIKIEQLTLESLTNQYQQAQLDAKAEIESAFVEYGLNRERFEAAQLALLAAQVNYQAAIEANKEGAGTLLEILTARVSLTTAESNLVQANYDLKTSEIRLKLVMGQALPGEQPIGK